MTSLNRVDDRVLYCLSRRRTSWQLLDAAIQREQDTIYLHVLLGRRCPLHRICSRFCPNCSTAVLARPFWMHNFPCFSSHHSFFLHQQRAYHAIHHLDDGEQWLWYYSAVGHVRNWKRCQKTWKHFWLMEMDQHFSGVMDDTPIVCSPDLCRNT